MEKGREKRAQEKDIKDKIEYRNYEDKSKTPVKPFEKTKPIEFKFRTDELRKNRSVYLNKSKKWSNTSRPEVYQSEYDLLPKSEQKKFQRPHYPPPVHSVIAVDNTNKGKGVPPMEIYKTTVPKAPSFQHTTERKKLREQRKRTMTFNEYVAKQKNVYQEKLDKEKVHYAAMYSAKRAAAFKRRSTKEKHDELMSRYAQYSEHNNSNNLSLENMSKLALSKPYYASQQGLDLSSVRGYGNRGSMLSYGSVDHSITSELLDYYDYDE